MQEFSEEDSPHSVDMYINEIFNDKSASVCFLVGVLVLMKINVILYTPGSRLLKNWEMLYNKTSIIVVIFYLN